MASAFHHAERPHELLRECHRVLRSSGRLLLLNEVPYPVPSMLRYVATTAVAAAVNATNATLNVTKRGNVSSERILYDEQLGDHAMTMPQWRRVLGAHTFDLEVFDTGLPPYKSSYRKHRPMDRRLTHFFLQKR
jgi:SAM-dependent methyltransferase